MRWFVGSTIVEVIIPLENRIVSESHGTVSYPLVVSEVVELPALLLLARLSVLMLFPPPCLIPALLEAVLLEPSAAATTLHWPAVH